MTTRLDDDPTLTMVFASQALGAEERTRRPGPNDSVMPSDSVMPPT